MEPIGYIHSPFTQTANMPVQPRGAAGVRGEIRLKPELAEGLKDIEGFSHLYLIYHFHQAGPQALTVVPFLDQTPRGVFATRSPLRPNPIGLSVVRLVSVDGAVVVIEGVDVLDGTPLLDLKPYIPAFDQVDAARSGWMEASKEEVAQVRSDDRFA